LREHKFQHVADISKIFEAKFPGGAWDRPSISAVIIPIMAAGEGGHSSVLIAGLNPFRLFDDNYCGFMELVAGQIASAIANAEAFEQERRRAEALTELDRAKTAFFSNVSHEFRTPLTLMLNPMEELLGEEQPPQTRSLVAVAHRNGLRLLKLVNSLLDFSRVETGRIHTSFERSDLPQLTKDIAKMFEPAMSKAGLRLKIDCKSLPSAGPSRYCRRQAPSESARHTAGCRSVPTRTPANALSTSPARIRRRGSLRPRRPQRSMTY
jgi:signal transduction histidine kinase